VISESIKIKQYTYYILIHLETKNLHIDRRSSSWALATTVACHFRGLGRNIKAVMTTVTMTQANAQ